MSLSFLKLATLAVLLWCLLTATNPSDSQPVELTNAGRRWASKILASLSLEEKVGQLLQVRYYGDYSDLKSGEYAALRDQISKYHIGSVVSSMHFNAGSAIRSSPLDAARVANQLQADSKLPLLLAADIERGVASRLKDVPSFPWPMAMGATGDVNQTARFGAVTAREARAVGVQWALAPVADVNSNPANPIINDRSFGEDPQEVAAMVAAYIRGAHENGLLVTAKHFPGHGDSAEDSHRSIPVIAGDLAHLKKFELPPFEAAISAGVDSIMLAHARVPAIDSDPDKIATISRKVVNDLLKKELRFKGLVVTDALEMKGITELYAAKKGSPTALAAVDAIKAGCDVIMIPTDLDGAFHAIIDAVKSGEIPESRINESVRKILEMKASVGLDQNRFVDLDRVAEVMASPVDLAFAQQIADDAITLVRNDNHLLPLVAGPQHPAKSESTDSGSTASPGKLVAVIVGEAFDSSNGHEFEKAIRERHPDAKVFVVDSRGIKGGTPDDLLRSVGEAQTVVVSAYVAHRATRAGMAGGKPTTSYGLVGPTGIVFQRILDVAAEKTVVIALGSPYLIEGFPAIKNYICAYAMATTSEKSAVKALFGEVQNHARLPVTLPGVAERGFFVPWPKQPQRVE
jgi:beta-N-acetylhexosaminidase